MLKVYNLLRYTFKIEKIRSHCKWNLISINELKWIAEQRFTKTKSQLNSIANNKSKKRSETKNVKIEEKKKIDASTSKII